MICLQETQKQKTNPVSFKTAFLIKSLSHLFISFIYLLTFGFITMKVLRQLHEVTRSWFHPNYTGQRKLRIRLYLPQVRGLIY